MAERIAAKLGVKAEFVMKKLLRRAGRDDIEVESAALHTDEIGNDIHRSCGT